ncbi:2-C-methyl-D-erythritol 4-phosphate cytidylyltransferase [Paenibacillus sp. FSL W8-0186]|uniref:2-C-methyl-D-erythritol 4-phosphate cytidylyltransferase n=1 Tax=Paenibacillus sp. FSL W8-0186 TaxID=2921709 RepID=UPI0030D145FA
MVAQANSPGAGAIIVAAGRGTRMGTKESKQYLMLQDKPIVVHTLEVFDRHPLITEIVLVTGEQDVERVRAWIDEYGIITPIKVIPGGAERQHSVYQGLLQLSSVWVLVHDGVRPFVTEEQVTACYEAAVKHQAAVLAVPVKDTVKQVDEQGWVTATPDRRSLWAIQTPQAFRRSDLMRAHEEAAKEGFVGTDDSMLAERMGIPVRVVEGAYGNIKITTPDDLDYAEFVQSQKEAKGRGNA